MYIQGSPACGHPIIQFLRGIASDRHADWLIMVICDLVSKSAGKSCPSTLALDVLQLPTNLRFLELGWYHRYRITYQRLPRQSGRPEFLGQSIPSCGLLVTLETFRTKVDSALR